MNRPQHVLLIESEPTAADAVMAALPVGAFDVEWVTTLADGISRLPLGGLDAVAFNLALSDSRGPGTLDALLAAAPHVPVLILCTPDDEAVAQAGVQHGAQDYLLTNHSDTFALTHALTNMIDRKTLEESLFVAATRASVTLESIGDAVLSTDNAGNVTYLNAVAETMTGWSRTEADGHRLTDVFRIVDGVTGDPARNPAELAIRENRTVGLAPNCLLVRRDGSESPIEDSTSPIHDRSGQVTGAVIVFHEVSESREMSRQISHLAHHDSLTDLPNRLLLHDRITQAIAIARRHGDQIAVLFLDLDRFKQVNDSLGHLVGDQLLRMVGQRLKAVVRQSDTVSRLGGDEFVVVLTDLAQAKDAAIAARKILAALALPYTIDAHVLHVPVSIGASTYPEDGDDAETLIRHADTAMYAAKARGRNTYQFFRREMTVRASENRVIETGVREAVVGNVQR